MRFMLASVVAICLTLVVLHKNVLEFCYIKARAAKLGVVFIRASLPIAMLNRRPRRQINQMNVVPYIDVMLVLLVIFMVTAPMFTPGVITVPSVSKAAAIEVKPLEVAVTASGQISLNDNGQKQPVSSVDTLGDQIKQMIDVETRPVVISADANLKYSDVVKIADVLHLAGVKRVALTVKQRN